MRKEKDSVIKSHHTHSLHGSGQSSSDPSPLPSRGVIHLSDDQELIISATSDQQHLTQIMAYILMRISCMENYIIYAKIYFEPFFLLKLSVPT